MRAAHPYTVYVSSDFVLCSVFLTCPCWRFTLHTCTTRHNVATGVEKYEHFMQVLGIADWSGEGSDGVAKKSGVFHALSFFRFGSVVKAIHLCTQDAQVYLFFTWLSHALFLSLHFTNEIVCFFTYQFWVQRVRGAWVLRRVGPNTNNARST